MSEQRRLPRSPPGTLATSAKQQNNGAAKWPPVARPNDYNGYFSDSANSTRSFTAASVRIPAASGVNGEVSTSYPLAG